MNENVSYEKKCIACGEEGIFGLCYTCLNKKIIQSEKEAKKKVIRKKLNKDYRKSEKGKLEIKKYTQSEKGNLARKKANIKRRKSEKLKRYLREYYKKNREKVIKTINRYQRSEKGKIVKLRTINKRKRQLGFIPLNSKSEGSEAHHIDKNYIIYIPIHLHRSISHNIYTGKNIILINTIALDWIKS